LRQALPAGALRRQGNAEVRDQRRAIVQK